MPRTPIEIPPTVEYLGILDEDDELDTDLEPDLDDDLLLRMHWAMPTGWFLPFVKPQ